MTVMKCLVVPQRSVIGPLFLLIYISNLMTNIILQMISFADDKKIFGSFTTVLASG